MKGLTGKQGVIIPIENIEDLMLRDEVIEAVSKGQFHILPVSSVSEGIEILTGVRCGQRGADGKFEEGTVCALADARLRSLADIQKEFE